MHPVLGKMQKCVVRLIPPILWHLRVLARAHASRAKHFACPSVHVKRLDVVVRVRAPVRPHMQAKKFADLRIRRNVISRRRSERASGARARVEAAEGQRSRKRCACARDRAYQKLCVWDTTRGFGTQGFVNAVPEDCNLQVCNTRHTTPTTSIFGVVKCNFSSRR